MSEDRLTELEIKYAHQDQAIERLERTTFAQHRAIEDLERQLQRLSNKLEALGLTDAAPGDQKPPHY